MRISDSFTDEEKEKLENIGVELRDREYEISELRDIMDIIMDAVMNNLDEDGEFTELAEEYNWIHDKMLQIEDDAMYESENVIIRVYFNDEQIALLEKNDIDLDREYTLSDLEKLEDFVYNIMMSNLDENGEFTELAEKYEKIIDIIVKIENEM